MKCRGQYIMASPHPSPSFMHAGEALPACIAATHADRARKEEIPCSLLTYTLAGTQGARSKWVVPASLTPQSISFFYALQDSLFISTLAPGVPGSPCVETKKTQ